MSLYIPKQHKDDITYCLPSSLPLKPEASTASNIPVLSISLSRSHGPDFLYFPDLSLKFRFRLAAPSLIHCQGHTYLDRDRSHGRGRGNLILSERRFAAPFAVWT